MTTVTDILPPRYRSPKLVGSGGMGEIYRATDSTLGRAVAVKVLAQRFALDDDSRGRFTREALAAARLSGEPHIVTIFDVGDWNERPFIVMEYMGGGSVEEQLRRGKPELSRALRWLDETASALDAAHRAGVVHRDVKPGNLLLDRSGTLHVGDFGVASAVGTDSLTITGTIVGTAGYLSPEQARGERATAASDLYSLGVVAYELLTGSRPFEADSPTLEAAAHVQAPVPPVGERNPGLPLALDAVFRRALAKDPGARFGSAAELVGELRRTFADASPATVITRRRPVAQRRRSRGPLLVLLALLVAGVAGAAAAFLLLDNGGHEAQQQQQLSVRTITGRATTIERTVTSVQATTAPPPTTAPPTTTAAPPTTTAAPVGASGHSLNDQGYRRFQAGDLTGALPLFQQAVRALSGVGPSDPYEAYANYNLGETLLRLNRCAEALPYLETAKRLEPSRHEPKDALKQARICA